MGESACLMQPFSYTAGNIPNEAKEGNPVHALGQSISFGRFMSESLAWEKWSTFSHNKYVEEAERFARPGSVAQKKAFFEAHYRTLAARKAAALLEQANATAECEAEGKVQDITATQGSEIINSNSQMLALNQEVKPSSTEIGSIYDSKENNSDLFKFESSKVEHNVLLENNMKNDEDFEKNRDVDKAEIREETKVENFVKVDHGRKLGELIELELSEGSQMEKPLLKYVITNEDEFEVTSKEKPPHFPSKVSAYAKTSKVPYSPAKFTAPFRPNKGNNLTPVATANKPAMDISYTKRSTPKSSRKSINFTPAQELSRLTSTIIQKIDGPRMASYSKASKECSTPSRTPNTASTSGRPKQTSATPWSENRSARTPNNSSASVSKAARGKWNFLPTDARTPNNSSASVSKAARGKWNFLPTDCSKVLSACRKKSQSPGIFGSFSLRTEERAARRKQRLEEKFNVSKEQKQVQQQTTLKEKAETELRKLGQSFCFKARPLPDFYKDRKTTKDQMQKVPLTQPESPALGRKSTPIKASTAQSKNSLPHQKSSTKNTCFENTSRKNHISVRSLTSRVAMTARENTSPNIQHA